uniref:Ig-like domain-containing protein n=1 Tax=Ursus americanus TaxID=9643 RepID=A0A452QJG4_URSAM
MSPVVISLTCLGKLAPSKFTTSMFLGIYRKPSLLAQPGPLVKSGGNVTLHCCSEIVFESFIFHREGRHHGGSHANFSMGPVTAAHGGTYRYFGSLNRSFHEWSAPSDSLDIMITGLHQKPSLGAQPGAVVRSGENVTFSCCSESSFDVYHLSRDEQPRGRWLAKGQRRGGESQADFPLGPAHSALGRTYRCHGSFNRSPCEWSGPSDPLYLSITDGNRLSLGSHLPTGNPRHLHVLAGPLVAIVFLTVLLFFLTRRWCPAKESESPEEETSACLGGVGEPGSLHLLVDSWFKAEATEVRLSRENSRAPILTNRMEMGRHDWDVSLNFGEVDSLTLLSGSNSRHSLHLAVLCYLYL